MCYSRLFGDLLFWRRSSSKVSQSNESTPLLESIGSFFKQNVPNSNISSDLCRCSCVNNNDTNRSSSQNNNINNNNNNNNINNSNIINNNNNNNISTVNNDNSYNINDNITSTYNLNDNKFNIKPDNNYDNNINIDSNNNGNPDEHDANMKSVNLTPNNLNNNDNSNYNKFNNDSKIKSFNENGMSTEEWRKCGKEMVDYIANYIETIGEKRVTPSVEPGYLRILLPSNAPLKGEPWDRIIDDFDQYIIPGLTHWQHPRFHAYFPSGNSYPSILADMLSDAIGSIGFSWAASPACTELETIVLDWVGKMIGLPQDFLCYSETNSKGGGVIQGSASDCVLVSLLSARHSAIKQLQKKYPTIEDGVLLSKLIGYCSKESHSCVEKAAMIALVKLRILDTDEKFRLRGSTLAKAIQEDKLSGLVPFFVSCTLGTTSCCSFDKIDEIGVICEEENIWLHVDAAYAGNSFICPEFQYLLKGIEYASSFNTNPNKWMLVNFDCSLLWVKDRFKLTQAMVVDPLYLQHSYSDKSIDYRHWGIPLSRRFRSLKLWFVIRTYGIEGLQAYIRKHCRLAFKFEQLLLKDERFEVINEVILGLVCFRLKGSNWLNQKLLSAINASGKLHMVPASLNSRFVIRFCVCAQNATENDIIHAFNVIAQFASDLFEILNLEKELEPVKKEEDETADEVIVLDRKKKTSLRYKRSFFVRMVSDPKLYNPKIVKTLSSSSNPDSESDVFIPI